MVGSAGFVAQNVTPQQETVSENAPTDYRRLTSGAQRLSLDFRFKTGKSDLDNKATVDIDRVVSFIADLHYTGDRIMLFGFADSTGSRDANMALSLNRARVVQDQFIHVASSQPWSAASGQTCPSRQTIQKRAGREIGVLKFGSESSSSVDHLYAEPAST